VYLRQKCVSTVCQLRHSNTEGPGGMHARGRPWEMALGRT
jgi:hypothetical protein